MRIISPSLPRNFRYLPGLFPFLSCLVQSRHPARIEVQIHFGKLKNSNLVCPICPRRNISISKLATIVPIQTFWPLQQAQPFLRDLLCLVPFYVAIGKSLGLVSIRSKLNKQKCLNTLHDTARCRDNRGNHAHCKAFRNDSLESGKGSDKHLRNLNRRNTFCNPRRNSNFMNHETLVGLHNGVNSRIHDDKEKCRGIGVHHIEPTKQENRDMMKPMQKQDGFLCQQEKDSVTQFDNF
jgi:hypothetical protein